MNYFIMMVVLGWVSKACSAKPARGFGLALAFMVSLPTNLQIELGALPALTIQRLILAVLFLFWVGLPKSGENPRSSNYLVWLTVVFAFRAISTVFSIGVSSSLKDMLGFGLESLLFSRMAVG